MKILGIHLSWSPCSKGPHEWWQKQEGEGGFRSSSGLWSGMGSCQLFSFSLVKSKKNALQSKKRKKEEKKK